MRHETPAGAETGPASAAADERDPKVKPTCEFGKKIPTEVGKFILW